MKKKIALLASSSALLALTLLSAVALAGSGDFEPMACTWQYTYCSDFACPTGAGADGEHVYHCTTPPYVRTIATCCGG